MITRLLRQETEAEMLCLRHVKNGSMYKKLTRYRPYRPAADIRDEVILNMGFVSNKQLSWKLEIILGNVGCSCKNS